MIKIKREVIMEIKEEKSGCRKKEMRQKMEERKEKMKI